MTKQQLYTASIPSLRKEYKRLQKLSWSLKGGDFNEVFSKGEVSYWSELVSDKLSTVFYLLKEDNKDRL